MCSPERRHKIQNAQRLLDAHIKACTYFKERLDESAELLEDESRLDAHLTAIEDIWGPYYIERVQAILDGTWSSTDVWDGFKEGTVVISPYNAAVPADVQAEADKIIAGYKDGTFNIFTGPIYDQDGNLKVKEGEVISLADLAVMDWFVKGVESAS